MNALEKEERCHLEIAALISLLGACVPIGALSLTLPRDQPQTERLLCLP